MTAQLTTLDNGLRIVTDEMPGVETAALGIWVQAGTRHEPEGKGGVAHFLEHMAFKGTESRTAVEIASEIEDVGGYFNAHTGAEDTAYEIGVLRPDVPIAIDILCDVLLRSTFDADALNIERGVILQEIARQEDTPDDALTEKFLAASFKDQPLGRPGLGSPSSIEEISREDVLAFLDANYCPSRMVVAAAGAICQDEIVAIAGTQLSALPRKRTISQIKSIFTGGRELIESEHASQLHLMVGFAGTPVSSPEAYASYVLSTAFGGSMSSRLFQAIREKRGLAYDVGSYSWHSSDVGVFGVHAGTDVDLAEELLGALSDEILAIARAGLRPEELRRAKAQHKAGVLHAMERTAGRLHTIADWLISFGIPFDQADAVARIDQVSDSDIARVVDLWKSAAPTIAAIGPAIDVSVFDQFYERLC